MASAAVSAFGLLDEACSALGGQPALIVDAAGLSAAPRGAIVIGVDTAGALPRVDAGQFDALVTTRPDAPAPWVSIAPARIERRLERVRALIAAAPIAASVLARLLRISATLSFDDVLAVESLGYSTLLGGSEFAAWRDRRGPAEVIGSGAVRYARAGDHIDLHLACPATRNAMTATMRDALFEALANVVEDPTRPSLTLRGDGRCFSTGGDLAEFGSARDLAAAHIIRTQRSCASLLLHLGPRAEARVHGACIGSGIEIAAACARVVGAPDTFAQLPELSMGLIPGVGGTVTLPRRIGRHRTAWLALSGVRLTAREALAWGLLDAIEE